MCFSTVRGETNNLSAISQVGQSLANQGEHVRLVSSDTDFGERPVASGPSFAIRRHAAAMAGGRPR